MPIFTASGGMSANTASSCCVEELRRHFEDGRDARGVLRGERRDGGGGVHAVHRHGFEICLNAGACAGIAPRDG